MTKAILTKLLDKAQFLHEYNSKEMQFAKKEKRYKDAVSCSYRIVRLINIKNRIKQSLVNY